MRADPRPIVHFGFNNIAQADFGDTVIADLTVEGNGFEYQVPGYEGGEFGLDGGEHFWQVPRQTGDLSVGLQADLKELPSGLYDYTINSGLYTFANNRFTGSSAPSAGNFVHVNSVDSNFGSGWSIAGWQELVENDNGSLLLVDGDGEEILFQAPENEGENYISPPGDFSTLERQPDGTFKRTSTDKMVSVFNFDNQLESVTDPNGNRTTFEYGAEKELTKIVDSVGLETSFTYEAGKVTSISDPAGKVTQLEYDEAGNLTSITDPDDTTRTWSYDNNRLMVSEIDQKGDEEQAFYDQFGRADNAILKDGSTIKVDPLQTQGLYSIEATTNPLSPPDALIESPDTQPVASYVDGKGNVTAIEVDQAGQEKAAVDGGGSTGTIERNEDNLIVNRSDGRGNEIDFTYDANGNVLTIQDSLTLANNAGGSALIINGAEDSSEPQVSLNATNTVDSLLLDSGFETTIANDLPSDLSGYEQVWDLRYDNSASLSDPQQEQYLNFLKTGGNLFLIGENTVFAERNDSILNLIDEAGGGQLDFVLPSSDQQVLSPFDTPNPVTGDISYLAPGGVSNVGTGQFITTDEENRGAGVAFTQGSLSNAASGELTVFFDLNFLENIEEDEATQNLLNNLTELESRSALQSYAYDPVFNQVTSYTDELGRLTINDIDPENGNILSTTQVIGEVGGDDDLTISYTYTSAGLVDTMTDPEGRVTDYDYDEYGRLIKETFAVGTADEAFRQYEYDAAGNTTAVIDENGNRTEFQYDKKNRVTQITEADPDGDGELTSPTSTFAYDELGNLIEVVDAKDNSTQHQYDELSRKVSTTDSLDRETQYEYDAAGNVIAMVDAEGRRVESDYDSRNRLTEILDPLGNSTKYRYDLDDNLTVVTDPLGNTTRNFYDSRNRLFRTIDAEDNVTSYEYDAVDNLTATVDANEHRTEYEYDDLDRQVKRINAEENEFVTEYDAVGNVIATTDEESRTTNLEYDQRDRLTESTDAENKVASFEYDAVGNLLAVTDEEERTTNFTYDALNRQTEIIDPLDNPTSYSYDPVGNLTSVTDANEHTTSYSYDKLNRVDTVTNAVGDTFETDYDAVGNIISTTDEENRTTTFAYDEQDLLTTVTDAVGNTTTTTYDEVGNAIAVTDARDNTTNYEYDKLYRLIKEIDANGEDATYQYDPVGNLLGFTDELDRTTTFGYDSLNRRISITDPLLHTTTQAYDKVGNLISVTDANNHTTSYSYDKINRPTVITNHLGDTVESEYDRVGNVTAITDELKRTTTFTYDDLNRQTSITDPLTQTSTTEYDAVGNVLAVTDPLNNTTNYEYDKLNRLIEEIDAENRATNYGYDSVGNLVSITDPEQNTTSYTYDLVDRLISDTNQLGDTRSYEYDEVGNRISSNDRNDREINYQFDNLNRNTAEVWLDEAGNPIRTFNFEYDAASQLIDANDPDSAYSYEYDLDGRIASVDNASTPGVPNVVFDYQYDPVDNLTSVTDSINGTDAGVETFTYDELDRVTEITQSGNGVADKRVDMSYDGASQMTGIGRYSDLDGTQEVASSTYTYDDAGRLTNLTHDQDGEVLSAYDWAYDRANRITQATSPDGVSDYSYDKSDQLVDADHDYQDSENYVYDDNGNRVNDGYVTGENNQLLSDGTYNYEYDAEGNRVRRTEIATGEVTEYEWDYRNRLVAVETTDVDGNVTANADYTYDVFDRRIAKSVDGDGDGVGEAVVKRYVHDGDHIALTFDGEGNQIERFLHGTGIDQVLAQENESGEVLWALADNQGSVRMVLDNEGNVVNEITYDAFGNITVESNPDVNFRFSYTGRELDPETGLYNYRSRYYDPAVGQFINEDTIGFAGGDSNLYRYVVNNPVNYTDPYGEDLYDVLNTADQFAAGFADTVTLGLSTKFREAAYGDLAARNHNGGVFNAGRVTGGLVALATGFNTPGNFAAGLSWAQKAAIGYEVAATGYGAYDATSKFLEGCATPLDALNFLPLAGYGLGRLRGLNNVDDAGRALNQASNAVGDAGSELNRTNNALQDIGDAINDSNLNRNLQNTQQQLSQGADDFVEQVGDAGNVLDDFPTIANKFPDESLDPSGKIFGEVKAVDGKATLTNEKLIPRQPVDFVVTKDNRLVVGKKHTTLSGGNDVKAAGTLAIKGGKIRRIDNLSGHFRPTVEEGQKFPELLKKSGLDVSGANLKLYDINIDSNGLVDNLSVKVNTYLP